MLDQNPENMFLKTDKTTAIYYDLRKIELDRGKVTDVRAHIGRMYDLLNSFNDQYLPILQVHPDSQHYVKRFKDD